MRKKTLSTLILLLIMTVATALSIITVSAGAELNVDTGRSFSVYENSVTTVSGGKVTIHYTSSVYGAGEYVSVSVITPGGGEVFSNRLDNISSSAIVELSFDLPGTIPAGTSYIMRFFSENGSVRSEFSTVSLVLETDPYITTLSLPETTQGTTYGAQLRAICSGTPVWNLAVGSSLPSGLQLSSDGRIHGAPTVAGTYNFTVEAKYNGNTSQKALTIKVNPPISVTFNTNLTTGTVAEITVPQGKELILTAKVSGGTPGAFGYRWSTGGSQISGANGLTYKIPTDTVGIFVYSFAATDQVTANGVGYITVNVRTAINASLNQSSVVFDKATGDDIVITKSDGDFTFSGILKNRGNSLVSGTDFTISGNTVTISKEYLKNQPCGDIQIVFDYSDTSNDPSLSISVIDTSLPPAITLISTPAAIKRGESLSLTPPTVTVYGNPVTAEGWKIKRTTDTSAAGFSPSITLDCSYNGAILYYYATNSAGTTESNKVTVTVNHVPASGWSTNSSRHWHSCPCGEVFDSGSHSYDVYGICSVCGYGCSHVFSAYVSDNNASCTSNGTKSRVCQLCGQRESIEDKNSATGHKPSEWQVDSEKHWKVCTVCAITTESASHIGGTATCTHRAVCAICSHAYSETLPHTYNRQVIAEKYLASPKTETSYARYYYSCECGEHGNETFEYRDDCLHAFTKKLIDQKTLAIAATCTSPAKYFFICEKCGAHGAETFEYGDPVPHTPGPAATYDEPQICVICGKILADKLTGKPDDTNTSITLTPSENGEKDKPSFDSDTPLGGNTNVSLDDRELGKDEYTISEDGKNIVLHPNTGLKPGTHTVTITDGNKNGSYTFKVDGSFPWWLLWVIPHVAADIVGVIVIIVLVAERKRRNQEER